MKREKPVYNAAFGLNGGTVFSVLPVRKPPQAEPDPEGVCTFCPYKEVVPADLPDPLRTAFFAAVSLDINVRRVVQERVVARLDTPEKEVDKARK